MNSIQRSVLAYFLKQYWQSFALILLLGFAVAGLEAATLAVLMPIFNGLIGSPSPAALGSRISQLLALFPFKDPLVSASVVLITLTPLKSALTILQDYMLGHSSGRLLYDSRKRFVEKYFGAPYDYILSQKHGRLMHICLASTTYLSFIIAKLPQLLMEILRAAAILLFLFSLQPAVTLGLVVVAALLSVLVGYLGKNISYTYGKVREQCGLRQKVLFGELFTGLKHISVFGVKERWLDLFDEANATMCRLSARDASWLSAPRNVLESVAVVGVFGSMLALRATAPDRLSGMLPMAGTFAMGLLKLLPALSNISRARMEMMTVLPEVETVHEALTLTFKPRPAGNKPFRGLQHGISFEAVDFGYEGRAPLLKGMDLEFPRNKTTAIVGDSGSGKSTILNLLLRLFDPAKGRILVDGVSLAELELSTWLSRIGLVSQDTFIYHASIAENIVFGRNGFTQAEVERAARVAHAHDFISQMPEGYGTLTGEHGLKLSGGQQQRIAIARAVLGEPEIFIFDEATSALDSVSEAAVQRAIAEVSAGRTVIQVAHRLSTIQDADNIIVLQNGRVAEQGSHGALVAAQGAYSRFFQKQRQPAG